MRVLITTGIYPPDIGGPATSVPKIARALATRGHHVTVLTMADVDGREVAEFGTVVRVDRRRGLLSRKAASFWALVHLLRDADLLYVNGLFEEVFPALALFRRRVVAKVVGDWAWERLRLRDMYQGGIDAFQRDQRLGLRPRLFRRLRSLVMHPYHDVIVNSHYLAGIVAGWYSRPPRIHVVHNGVELEAPASSNPDDNAEGYVTLCTVCRLVPWKRVDEIITSLPELPKTRLVVVGDGPERRRLDSLVGDLGLGERVVFCGAVTRRAALAQLACSDIVVHNSDYESLPYVIIEAMALGKPVVARRCGGTMEVVHDGVTGLLVADRGELEEAIRHLVGDRERCRRMGAAARRRYCEAFTEEAMLNATVEILERSASP